MNRREFSIHTLGALGLSAGLPGLAVAQGGPVEGTHYVRLPQAAPVSAPAGKVEVVSADALVDGASGQPYYSIRVGLSPSDTGDTQVPLQPGMPVHVLVRTGERPLLVYLLRPLLTRFVDALHD